MKFAIDSGLKGQILRLLPLTEPWRSSDTSQGGAGGGLPEPGQSVDYAGSLAQRLGGAVRGPLLGGNFKKITFPDRNT